VNWVGVAGTLGGGLSTDASIGVLDHVGTDLGNEAINDSGVLGRRKSNLDGDGVSIISPLSVAGVESGGGEGWNIPGLSFAGKPCL